METKYSGPTVNLYSIENYDIGKKESKVGHSRTPAEFICRIRRQVEEEGMRNSVYGVILVHDHQHPNILLLKSGSSTFKLPGGRIKPGEEDTEGLKRKLNSKLSPALESLRPDWEVGELVSKWCRPNYETHLYPYIPPHISSPKEFLKLFCVPLPQSCKFAVPSNMELVAIPLFELYDNKDVYGPVIASLPQELSRFNYNYL